MLHSRQWAPCPYQHASFVLDLEGMRALWPRLHAGDVEPWPRRPLLQDAWRLFHAGRFQDAHDTGLAAAEAGHHGGLSVANKAQACHAHYLERDTKARLEMFHAVAERATRHQQLDPECANAYFWQAYALGRQAQTIGVAKGVGLGLGPRILAALNMTIELAPKHADAHLALGSFHAEVIAKLGRLLARIQGAELQAGLSMYQRAATLNPLSPLAMLERANGLLMLEGDKRQREADALYIDAAAAEPRDAVECFAVELARDALDE